MTLQCIRIRLHLYVFDPMSARVSISAVSVNARIIVLLSLCRNCRPILVPECELSAVDWHSIKNTGVSIVGCWFQRKAWACYPGVGCVGCRSELQSWV